MIKLGIFGDQSTNPELLEQVKTMSDTKLSGVYFSGKAIVPEGFTELSGPIELMDISDALLILNDKSISSDLAKLILRKSKHLYLKAIPNLDFRDIKELIGLEKEAGIVTFIYNRFNYIPFLDPFKNKYEKPLLINLRTCFEGVDIKPSHEMLLLVIALNRMVRSNFKKLEIFGLNKSGKQLILNLRIEYDNGSVINLTISHEKSPGCCEVFDQNGKSKFEFQEPLYFAYPQLNQEYIAIRNFVQLIQNQGKKENSFDHLMNGVQIVHEIREHLRFNGVDF
jgi:hypothetical protein